MEHSMRIILAALAASSLSALPATAWAHAHLRSASPDVGSTIKSAPATVTCDYTEALEPSFSTLEVRDATGAEVDAGDMHLNPHDAKQMVIGLKPLKPGTYKVIWHATSVDTHRTEGDFSFTVAP
jgi:methionine-rich copper-binding protein CopC